MVRRHPFQAAALVFWLLALTLGFLAKSLGIPSAWVINTVGLASGLLAGTLSGTLGGRRRRATSRVAVGLLLAWAGMGLYRFFSKGDESGLLLFCMWGGCAAGHLVVAFPAGRARAGAGVHDT